MQTLFVFVASIVHYILNVMKRLLLKITKSAALIFLILFVILAALIFWSENDKTVIEKYVKNERLTTVKADWRGTPVDQKGRFVNHEFPFFAFDG